MRLTKAGEQFLPYAENALAAIERIYDFQGDLAAFRGELHIGTAESLLCYHLPPVLQAFSSRAPMQKYSSMLWTPQRFSTCSLAAVWTWVSCMETAAVWVAVFDPSVWEHIQWGCSRLPPRRGGILILSPADGKWRFL